MDADGFLELFDILSAALSEGSLRLSVALFALFRSGIDLYSRACVNNERNEGYASMSREVGVVQETSMGLKRVTAMGNSRPRPPVRLSCGKPQFVCKPL